eukprot:11506736-Alexandrium_andersonii.AAC.1
MRRRCHCSACESVCSCSRQNCESATSVCVPACACVPASCLRVCVPVLRATAAGTLKDCEKQEQTAK